jgi:conjugal transfer pilus assembly protein TraV
MIRRNLLVLGAATLMAGCASLGGHVKGSFACRAPEGSCAPTMMIDVRGMAVEAQHSPGPARRAAGAPVPVRTSERTVTILLPAYIDGRGVLHEQAIVHAVVDGPDWATSSHLSTDSFSRSPAPSSLREIVAGASAPAIEGLEPLPTQAPHPDLAGPLAGMPSPAALKAARAGHRIGQGRAGGSNPVNPVAVVPSIKPPQGGQATEAQQQPVTGPDKERISGEPDLRDFLRVEPRGGGDA